MHRKISSLIAAITIVLLTVTATFTALQMYPKQAYALNITNSVSMSPMTLTLSTLPETFTYWVNVTSTGTDYINNVDIELPTGWTYAGGAVGQGYSFATTATVGSAWVNFTGASPNAFDSGAIANFSIPVTISTVPPTTGTWTVYCYQGSTPSASNPVTVTVTVNLEFHATMSPSYVRNGTSYIYTVTVTNDLVPTSIVLINITFPAGTWIFNALVTSSPATWTVHYDNINTFYLIGGNLYTGDSASITVNMTTPFSATTGIYPWNVLAWASNSSFLGTYSIEAIVSSLPPVITFTAPDEPYYSNGPGGYIWINATIDSSPDMALYFSQYSVAINDTRFVPYAAQPYTEYNSTEYYYYFVNNTAIPDGPLSVEITATDPALNVGTNSVSTFVDNTKPRQIELYVYGYDSATGTYLLYQDSSGNYWMTALTSTVFVYAEFSNPSGYTGKVYFNSTSYPYANDTDIPGGGVGGYSVVGSNLVVLNITLTDTASPNANIYSVAWNIERETTKPSAPSYTTTTTICGGFIIRGLTATDIVGVYGYYISLNGSTPELLYPSDLNSGTLDYYPTDYCDTIQNITIIDLFNYYSAGDVANITINAVNYGSNVGPPLTFLVTVPAGQWYPIEMQPKWNLISFPLIPNSTATSDIYSLLLLHGASGVNFAYSFDNTAKTWTLNPTSMSDGNGYWIDMNAYDVLIVQGYPISTPPGSPPPIAEYSLTTGWNIAGFTETDSVYAPTYVASLQYTYVLQTYFRFAYVWDATSQEWYTVDLLGSLWPYDFYSGQGFYIYMYNSQTLIPPT